MNRLPMFAASPEENIFDAILQTKELDIFRSKTLLDFSNYHWNTYASKVIWCAFLWHCLFMIVQFLFVSSILRKGAGEDTHNNDKLYLIILTIPLVFRTFYELRQFLSTPRHYFKNKHNLLDLINITVGITNLAILNFSTGNKLHEKVLFLVMIFCSTLKLVSLMRIFPPLAHIVAMF